MPVSSVSNENISLNTLDHVISGFPEKLSVSPNKENASIEKIATASNILRRKRPSERRSDRGQKVRMPLTEKKIVTLHKVPENSPVSVPFHVKPVVINPDIEAIERALGGTELSHVEKFEKEHGHTIQSIIDAMVLELAVLRDLGHPSIGFGGFKKAGIKKWKFLVEFDDDGKITDLAIGKFKIAGGFTKVYFTLDKRVISVPKKQSSFSNIQLINAHQIISHLYTRYLQIDREGLEKVLDVFPPLPKKMLIGERPILITPQAVGDAAEQFKTPATLSNVLPRLEFLRDATTSLVLCHHQGAVHGDIKPSNILISEKFKGILHDFGGGCIFREEDTPEIAGKKLKNVSQTSFYVHYRDYLEKYKLIKEKAPVNELMNLAQASDVYGVGVSILDALIGRNDANGVAQHPFQKKAYCLCEITNKWFPFRSAKLRQEVTLFQGLFPVIDGKLQALLDRALDPLYEQRLSSKKLLLELDDIIILLKDALKGS